MYLLKIAFPYWSNVCFGCDWHILTSELALLSVSQKDENPALFPVISIRCRLAHRPIPFLLLGSLGIGKRCFESRNNSTNSNPFADGLLISREISEKSARCPSSYSKAFRLLPKSGSSKVCFELLETFRVTPKALPPGCLSEVGQPVLTLWCSWSIPCTLCRIILSCCTAWYVRCRAMPQPICGCLSPVPAHG